MFVLGPLGAVVGAFMLLPRVLRGAGARRYPRLGRHLRYEAEGKHGRTTCGGGSLGGRIGSLAVSFGSCLAGSRDPVVPDSVRVRDRHVRHRREDVYTPLVVDRMG